MTNDVLIGIGYDHDERGLSDAERAMRGLGDTVGGATSRGFDILNVAAGNVLADLAMQLPAAAFAAGQEIIALGADAEETAGLIQNSLGSAADGYIADMEMIADVTNRSSNELLQSSSSILAMSRSMGMAEQQAADFTSTFANVAVDLGSFFNVDQAAVFEDIQSAMAGSSETMQKYGIDVSVTALNNAALNMGLIEQGEELDRVTKAQVLQAEIMRQASDAMGDAERTADSYTNQSRKLQSIISDTATEIGKELIPALTPMVTELASLAEDVAPAVIEKSAAMIQIFSNMALVASDVKTSLDSLDDNARTIFDSFEGAGEFDKQTGQLQAIGTFGLLGLAIEPLTQRFNDYAESLREVKEETESQVELGDSLVNLYYDNAQAMEENVIVSEDLADATFNVLEGIDQERLAFEGAVIKAQMHADALKANEEAARAAADAQAELVREQVNAFNEGGRLFDDMAQAAEDGKSAADLLAESYRNAAFEATIAQNGFNEATAELAVNLGLMTEEEAASRLEFVETSAALDDLTSNVDFLSESATNQTEAIQLLSGGFVDSAEDALHLSGIIDGDLSEALVNGGTLTQDLNAELRQLAGDYEIRVNASVNGLENLREAQALLAETRRADTAAGRNTNIGFEDGLLEEAAGLENRGFG